MFNMYVIKFKNGSFFKYRNKCGVHKPSTTRIIALAQKFANKDVAIAVMLFYKLPHCRVEEYAKVI